MMELPTRPLLLAMLLAAAVAAAAALPSPADAALAARASAAVPEEWLKKASSSGGPLTYVGPNQRCPPASAAQNASTKAFAPVCAAPDAYACALKASMRFFDAQRSGPLAGGPSASLGWRGDSGLKDVAPNGKPLVGGWYDGGDTSKFVFPGCWAVSQLAWAYDSFRPGFESAGVAGRLLADLKFESDFIVAARYDNRSMVAYTSAPGDLTTSHRWWGRPEDIVTPAVVGVVRDGQPAADLLAACAAALASTAVALRPTDAAAADKYVGVAKGLYSQAIEPATLGLYTDSGGGVPELRTYYNSTTYHDDLAWAAAWLSRATGDASYLDDAKRWYASMPHILQRDSFLSWDQVGQAAGVLIASQLPHRSDEYRQYTLATRVNMLDWMSEIPSDNDFQWTRRGGLPLVSPWGSARYVAAQAFTGLQLARLLSDGGEDRAALSQQRVQAYGCFAQQVMRQILGESGTSMVVGVGIGRQLCRAAHRGASCPASLKAPCDCRNLYTAGCNPNNLLGALLGGAPRPTANETANGVVVSADAEVMFEDNRDNYQTNEPALDYQVSLVGALSGLAAGAASIGPDFPSWQQCQVQGLVFPLPNPTGIAALEGDARAGELAGLYQMAQVRGGIGATRGWDPVGLILLAGFLLCVALYHLRYWLAARAEAKRWDPVASGAFRLAAARGDVPAMRLVARRIAQRRGRGRGGWTGPDCTALDGWTALHAACVQGQAGAAEWLCAQGSDVEATKHDDWNDTPLSYAAAAGSRATCDVLLGYGADPAARNFAGRTPADAAETAGHGELAAYLRAAAAAAAAGTATAALPPRKQPLDAAARAAALGFDATNGDAAAPVVLSPEEAAAADALCRQDYQGWGTAGTRPARHVRGFRVLAVLTYVAWTLYILWRALRTLGGGTQPLIYIYSVPFWLAEAMGWVGGVPFFLALWHQIDREERDVRTMALSTRHPTTAITDNNNAAITNNNNAGKASGTFAAGSNGAVVVTNGSTGTLALSSPPQQQPAAAIGYPSVDVYVVCYSEPLAVIEPTVVAALNMSWPGKLTVYVCDDGRKDAVKQMVATLNADMRALFRAGAGRALHYVCRDKVKGVPHHAKSGNINNCLTLGAAPPGGRGDFMLLLDCDMIAGPTFLVEALGHFYELADGATGAGGGGAGGGAVGDKGNASGKKAVWARKPKMAFLQTPQDFYNLSALDPLAHGGRLFYGPLQQGRDGVGAVCCCGTGVIWQRDVLVSCGGFAHDSITEDNLTSQKVAAAGFAGAYLNRRAIFGLAPDDIPGTFEQRLRWCMGALQILSRRNPLAMAGMTTAQKLLYFDSCAYSLTAPANIMLTLVPVIFLFTHTSPFEIPRLWELCCAFGAYFVLMQLSMWQAHRGAVGGRLEHWRGQQVAFWMSFNQVKGMLKVLKSESRFLSWLLRARSLGFVVTAKGEKEETRWTAARKALPHVWPHLLYVVVYLAGVVLFVVSWAAGGYDAWQVLVTLVAVAWGALTLLYLSPPLMPLVWPAAAAAAGGEQGWEVEWRHGSVLDAAAAGGGSGKARPHEQQHSGKIALRGSGRAPSAPLRSVGTNAALEQLMSAVAQQQQHNLPAIASGELPTPTTSGGTGGTGAAAAADGRASMDVSSGKLPTIDSGKLSAVDSGPSAGLPTMATVGSAGLPAWQQAMHGVSVTAGPFVKRSAPSWRDATLAERVRSELAGKSPFAAAPSGGSGPSMLDGASPFAGKAPPAAAAAAAAAQRAPSGATSIAVAPSAEVVLARPWAPGQLLPSQRTLAVAADPTGRAVDYKGITEVLSHVYGLVDEDQAELAAAARSERGGGGGGWPTSPRAAANASAANGDAKAAAAADVEGGGGKAGGQQLSVELGSARQGAGGASVARSLRSFLGRVLSTGGGGGAPAKASDRKLLRGRPDFSRRVLPSSTAGWMLAAVDALIVAALVAAAVLESRYAQGYNVLGPLQLLPGQ